MRESQISKPDGKLLHILAFYKNTKDIIKVLFEFRKAQKLESFH